MKAKVFITLKSGVLDPQGQAVCSTLGRLGFEEVTGVRIGKYVELTLDETDVERARERVGIMCEQLIANTVIEDYSIEDVRVEEVVAE
jgi:phosphoribosylformylglycinamidine synthase